MGEALVASLYYLGSKHLMCNGCRGPEGNTGGRYRTMHVNHATRRTCPATRIDTNLRTQCPWSRNLDPRRAKEIDMEKNKQTEGVRGLYT
jgi:hypothetical protein